MEEKQNLSQKIDPLAILSYLSFFCLIPLFLKGDEFVKFHARQGFTLFVLEILIGFLSFLPIIGILFSIFGGLFCLILSIFGIINVLKGNKEELPLIGQYAKIWKI